MTDNNYSSIYNNTNTADSLTDEASFESPVMIRRKIKSGYNWAASVFLWQQLIMLVLMLVIGVVLGIFYVPKLIAENPGMNQLELSAKITEFTTQGSFAVISNALSQVIGGVLTIIIVLVGTRRFKFRSLIRKPDNISPSFIVLAVFGVLAIQGISLFVQSFIIQLTGFTGFSGQMSTNLSFTDNTAANVILLIYAVIVGPIMEECIYRGVVLNLCAPVSRKFAIIVSSLLFGLMHCNFNQIFNAFLIGLLLGYIAVKSGSIVASSICHIFANANVFIQTLIFNDDFISKYGQDKADMFSYIIFIAEIIIGIAALILLFKKEGKIKADDTISDYIYNTEESESEKLTWALMLRSPVFWISAAFSIFTACTYIVQV